MTKGSHQLQLDSHSRKLFMEFVQLSRQRHFIHVRESHKCTFSNLKKCHQNQSCQEFLISCQSDKSLWKTWKKLVPLFYSFWRKTVNSKLMTMQKNLWLYFQPECFYSLKFKIAFCVLKDRFLALQHFFKLQKIAPVAKRCNNCSDVNLFFHEMQSRLRPWFWDF